MYNDVIALIGMTETTNAAGDTVQTETSREVFAHVKSVSMRETYEALGVGLKPELKFVLADYYDYGGERFADYDGVRWNVMRVYRTEDDTIELTVSR